MYAFREGASCFRAWRDECPRRLTWRRVSVVSRERGVAVGIVTFFVVLELLRSSFVAFRFSPTSLSRSSGYRFSPFLVLSFQRTHLRFRVVLLRVAFSFSFHFRFSFVFSLCVSIFRKGASFSFGFPSSYFVLRPVRLRSLARSLIVIFAPFFVFDRRVSYNDAG